VGRFDLADKQGHELIRLCHYQHEVNEGLTVHTVAALAFPQVSSPLFSCHCTIAAALQAVAPISAMMRLLDSLGKMRKIVCNK